MHRGRISFTYDKKKWRPYRYEIIKGNSYKFLKAKDANTVLQSVEKVLFTPFDKPHNLHEYLEYFEFLKIEKPKIMPVCEICYKNNTVLTKLSDDTTYIRYKRNACFECASQEINNEYLKRGIPITKGAKKYYSQQLRRMKSVEDVISVLWEPIQASRDQYSTLFDVIPADKTGKPVNFSKYVKQNNLSRYIDKSLLDNWNKVGMNKLLPVQVKAIEAGLMNKKDLLVVAGTSSGKTFVGELAGVQNWKANGTKFVFATPLVALSNQKFASFKQRYSKIGARVALRVGKTRVIKSKDKKSYPEGNFANADIVVATYEALDWIIRSGNWKKIGEIGTLVIDEFQLLADEERGAEVDGIIARIKSIFPKCQIIGLSATIGNDKQLANDFDLTLVQYMERPIELERHLIISDDENNKIDIITELVKNESKVLSSSNHRGQSLVFTNSRRRVQEIASMLKTDGIRSAYYHAGMPYFSRKRIEVKFEKGELDVLTTTAALGAGADFPVSQVIFERPGMGARWITIAEYHQMSGRAGRYGFHDKGKSIMIASPGVKIYSAQSKSEEQVAFDILTGEIEDVEGDVTLEQESDQVLAYISARYPLSESAVQKYYKLLYFRTDRLASILKHLNSKGLIVLKDEKFYITGLGRAISESFLEPSFGYEIARKTQHASVEDIAIEIAPLESIYLTSRIQGKMEQALKHPISSRFLSDGVLDIITSSSLIRGKITPFLTSRIKEWLSLFFDCNCKSNPFCEHPVKNLSKLVLELRMEGMDPGQISGELSKEYDLLVYQGDLINWLDEIIHAAQSISKLAKAMKEDEVMKNSNAFALSIEEPKTNFTIRKRGRGKVEINKPKSGFSKSTKRERKPRHLQRKRKKSDRKRPSKD
jgi:helicase